VAAPALGETELPEFCGGAVVVVNRLIHGKGVELAGAVAVDRRGDMGEQLGELCLVVGADPFARGVPFGPGTDGREGTAFQPEGQGPRALAAVTAAAAQIIRLLPTGGSASATAVSGRINHSGARDAACDRRLIPRARAPGGWVAQSLIAAEADVSPAGADA
jgi:hypothetical protein